MEQKKEPRTAQQNKALHVWYRLVADELNGAGYDLRKVLSAGKEGIDIEWTERMVKDILWRETQRVMFGKGSTTELSKRAEIDRVVETLNRFLAEKLGIEGVPFPSLEEE